MRIEKHTLPLISTVVSKLKDFSRSQTVTYNVKCEFSYIYETIDKISTNVVRRMVPLR